jgi:DNA relaxase NicK
VKAEGIERGRDLQLLAWHILEENAATLPAPRAAKLVQYEGWRAGPVGLMVHEEGTLLSLAGHFAQRYFELAAAINCAATRIDLAVDVMLSEPVLAATSAYARLVRDTEQEERAGYKSKFALITGSDGGSTLYLGRRASAHFGRLYDKGIESETERTGILWRYEVEYKQAAARSCFLAVNHTENRNDLICGLVYRHFQDRGVEPLFHIDSNPGRLQRETAEKTHLDSLNWLAAQVRPTVARLRLAGYEKEAYNSLGLDWQARSSHKSTEVE